MVKEIDIGRSPEPKVKPKRHVPSTVQPDTLFHFVSKREYLFDIIARKMVSPRYCKENLRYLRLPKVKQLAYPMACFCDIGLQKIEQHMDCYGSFGIAFPKEWCMANGAQSVQYLNVGSPLYQDIREAFKAARRLMSNGLQKPDDALADFLLHQLMYYKPYQGKMRYRVSGVERVKCLADECEWRFVPDARALDMPTIVHEEWALNNYLDHYSSALAGKSEVSLQFEIQDVKHIILRNSEDFSLLLDSADGWRKKNVLTEREIYQLLSKVLVWDEIRGDF